MSGAQAGRGALALLALAATLGLGCAPALDPAAQADVDRRIAGLRPSGQEIPAPRSFLPMPLAVGQWTEHRYRDDDGHPVLVTNKVVGEANGSFWIETATSRYSGREVTKMLVAGTASRDPARMEIRVLRTRDASGRVTDEDPNVLVGHQAAFRGLLVMLAGGWEGQPQEEVAVTAGRFAGCFKSRTEANWGYWRARSLVWSHPAVPLSGLVRGQRLDDPALMELVAYGESGAQSELE